ncbi:hypothetical protein B0H10DRAFT_925222 [Mycena sp. CBHHK59/15]|nr:hypothetical protein B0H10DRAFT_925222 [Mycena sp. CBHHK59/15]
MMGALRTIPASAVTSTPSRLGLPAGGRLTGYHPPRHTMLSLSLWTNSNMLPINFLIWSNFAALVRLRVPSPLISTGLDEQSALPTLESTRDISLRCNTDIVPVADAATASNLPFRNAVSLQTPTDIPVTIMNIVICNRCTVTTLSIPIRTARRTWIPTFYTGFAVVLADSTPTGTFSRDISAGRLSTHLGPLRRQKRSQNLRLGLILSSSFGLLL